MKRELADAIRNSIESGDASAALFLYDEDGRVGPHLSRSASDKRIDSVYVGDDRYPMSSFLAVVQPTIEGSVAVVGRECDRRMMVELSKHGKLELDRVVLLGIPCSQALADACGCGHPRPPDCVVDTDVVPARYSRESAAFSDDPSERLRYWLDKFKDCIRCNGCRNVCPMCFCNDCALDNPDIISEDRFPPEIPLFHLIRAVDMSDRCVDCGMCEEICPAGIPLRELYRQGLEVMREAFGYEPGLDPDKKSPLEMLGEADELAGMQDGFRRA